LGDSCIIAARHLVPSLTPKKRCSDPRLPSRLSLTSGLVGQSFARHLRPNTWGSRGLGSDPGSPTKEADVEGLTPRWSLRAGRDPGWSDTEMNCADAHMESAIPDCNNEVLVPDRKGAGKMHGVGASESVITRQLAGVAFDRLGELDRACRCPVLLPCPFRRPEADSVEIMVAGGGGKGTAYFGIGKPARDGGVAPVPEFGCENAPRLLDEKFHERARIEVDQRHRSATLLADDLGHRPARRRPTASRRLRPFRSVGPSDDAFDCQTLEGVGGPHPEQAGNGDAAVGHHDLSSLPGLLEPLAQMCPQFTDTNVHAEQCTEQSPSDCTHVSCRSASFARYRLSCGARGRRRA